MLVELVVRDLGVIGELQLVLQPGMSVLTGETGAGKTLLVDAINLLVGGRAEPTLVRSGASEARVDGRFLVDGTEHVLSRVIPQTGRSRAYVDGRPATATELAEWGTRLVDVHGQHSHQSLLSASVQRAALDQFGAVDLAPLVAARQQIADIDRQLADLGGDDRARAREIDLYRFQVEELDAAAIVDADEDDRLAGEEDVLRDAVAHQEAAQAAASALTGDGGAADSVGLAIASVADRIPFAAVEDRLRAVAAEIADLAVEVRRAGELIDPDPARLDAIRERRQLLHNLRRKYGDSLDEVLDYADQARSRLAELENHDANAARLDAERQAARAQLGAIEQKVGQARRAAAPQLAAAVQDRLAELAMPKARIEVAVGAEDPGDQVEIRIAANPGTEPRPLARVASGGELARTMLAIRLVLTQGPPILVFDEVDAGIGGEAAVAVGRALAALSPPHQVLVVTHLPQVAAHADHQILVAKRDDGASTTSEIRVLDDQERVVELSRMLSGNQTSEAAREHAAELLALAGRTPR